MQHRAIWKQLKRFSKKDNYCETCLLSDKCKSKINFGALARIYVYSLRVRQIADYTPKLVSFNIFKSGLVEPPLTYFSSIHSLLRENSLFYDCLADFMPTMKNGRRKLLEELRSPFIWGDEDRLKEAIREREDKGFYYCLLGRLYYERNRFEEAIEPLEKAKAISPRNAEVWNLLGTAYDAQAETKKDLKKALKHLKKARDLASSDQETLSKVGVLELALDNCPAAIADLTKALDQATTDFDKLLPLLGLSEAYRMKGMIDESESYLQESKRLFKHIDASLEWLRKYTGERRKVK